MVHVKKETCTIEDVDGLTVHGLNLEVNEDVYLYVAEDNVRII